MSKPTRGRLVALLIAALVLVVAMAWGVRLVGESRLAKARARFAAEMGSLSFADDVSAALEPLQVGRSVAADLRRALENGDPARIGRDLEELAEVWEASARESSLVSALIHLEVERELLGTVRDVLAAGGGEVALLANLQSGFLEHDCTDVVRRGFAGEAARALSAADEHGGDVDSTPRRERLLLWFLEPFQLAALLDTYGAMVESLQDPWIETLDHQRSNSAGAHWGYHQLMVPNLLDAVDKFKATELGRLLAIEALGRASPDPEDPLEDPYAGGTVRLDVGADGGWTLSAPDAIELWESEHSPAADSPRPIFTWRLPPAAAI